MTAPRHIDLRVAASDGESPRVELCFPAEAQVVEAVTAAAGFSVTSSRLARIDGNGIVRQETLTDAEGRRIDIIDRFQPTPTGVRWDTEVRTTAEEAFTVPLTTTLRFGDEWGQYWSAWGDDRPDGPETVSDPWAESDPWSGIANAELEAIEKLQFTWRNPLVLRAAENRRLWYGAPHVEADNERIGFAPFMNDLICMPLVSVFHDASDLGVTLALSPEDALLDVHLDVEASGNYRFSRMFNRLDKGRSLHFSADVFVHERDWRGSIRCLSDQYPNYFTSPLAITQDIAGCGAYSASERPFDDSKLKKMGFVVNWKASFDFPYMGMFLPDVPEDEPWTAFGGHQQTIAGLREYSEGMRDRGYHVLNYFNVTEFGAAVRFPLPEPMNADAENSRPWDDSSQFLSAELNDAVLLNEAGQPYWTWARAVVLDPGEPVFRDFLLEQARRHVQQLPASSGICIDRLDWTRFYNDRGDDGVSLFNGKPARSMQLSWQEISKELAEVFHAHNKVVYCNNHTKRIEQLLHVDGIFDEFTYAAPGLNLSALLGVFKPVLGWVAHAGQVTPDYHSFFQRFLYLGVFPMAPFPGNDHSLQPSPETDHAFLEYGPLFTRLRGKRWTLSERPVTIANDLALANVFEVTDGHAIPIVFAEAETVRVRVQLPQVLGADRVVTCEVLHPGADVAVTVAATHTDGTVEVDVPTKDGCALLLVQTT